MVHTLRLDNYSPTPRKLVLGTNSSFGTESIKIERGAGWYGLNLTATWHIPGREEPLRVALLDGDAMDVPPEVTKEAKDGVLVLAGLASGVQRASCNVEYLILEQAGVYGGADAEPTPELAAQVLKAALQAKADAEAAAEDAAAAKANAENAAADAAKAGPYAEAARAAQEAAEAARDEAIAAQRAAENAASAAAASKSAADTLAAEAARAAQSAENSKAAANNAADLAGENATAAQQAAATATAAANDAGQSASDAAASKAAAETAAKAAQDAQTAAAEAKAEAINAQGAAQTAAKSAQDAQAAAEKARDDAKTAQQGAETARDAAAGSAEAAAKSEANAKQSADTLAESVENVVANTAAVAELKEKKAEIDDTALGANAWSSKHIVDMLCPPLEESGNPVVCYPVEGYPLGVKAKWKPVQEGSGDPSPENIRPIKGRDSVTVNRTDGLRAWKALTLDGTEKWSNNGPVASIKKQEWAAYKILEPYPGTFGISSHFSDIKDSSVYPFNYVRISSTSIVFGVALDGPFATRDAWKSYLAAQYAAGTPVQICYKLAEPVVVPDTNGIFFSEQPVQVGSGNPSPDNIRPILLNNAVQVGQTNTLTLPETVYGGEVDAVTGDGNENTKIIMLDGTTNKFRLSGEFWNLPQNSSTGIRDGYDTNCSHFPPGTFGGNRNKGYLFTKPKLMEKYFQDVNAFNAYLAAQYAAGTPVQVCYKLVEPVPFTATGAQALPSLAGLNTILTDADSTTVTGRADPIKRITDLEDAVASQT